MRTTCSTRHLSRRCAQADGTATAPRASSPRSALRESKSETLASERTCRRRQPMFAASCHAQLRRQRAFRPLSVARPFSWASTSDILSPSDKTRVFSRLSVAAARRRPMRATTASFRWMGSSVRHPPATTSRQRAGTSSREATGGTARSRSSKSRRAARSRGPPAAASTSTAPRSSASPGTSSKAPEAGTPAKDPGERPARTRDTSTKRHRSFHWTSCRTSAGCAAVSCKA